MIWWWPILMALWISHGCGPNTILMCLLMKATRFHMQNPNVETRRNVLMRNLIKKRFVWASSCLRRQVWKGFPTSTKIREIGVNLRGNIRFIKEEHWWNFTQSNQENNIICRYFHSPLMWQDEVWRYLQFYMWMWHVVSNKEQNKMHFITSPTR